MVRYNFYCEYRGFRGGDVLNFLGCDTV